MTPELAHPPSICLPLPAKRSMICAPWRNLLAALCHDMGELHTVPAILATGHRITPEERHYMCISTPSPAKSC